MATKNIVPRADGEGSVGTSAKKWEEGYFDTIKEALGLEYVNEITQTPSGAFTVNWPTSHVQRITITGVNLDITFTNPDGPCRLVLMIIQGDGDDTIDWTNEADIEWPSGGSAPTLQTGNGDVDFVEFYFDGTTYHGMYPGGGGGGGAGDVSADAVIADHALVRGDGGVKKIQESGITVADKDGSDNVELSAVGEIIIKDGVVQDAIATATPSGSFTIDWRASKIHQITITGTNLDITFTDPAGPCRLALIVIQGDGDDTIDWSNEASIRWPGKVAPVLSIGSGDKDVVSFIFDGTVYLGTASYDFDI